MTKVILAANTPVSNARTHFNIKTIATFSASIAHELRGYLATIRICAEMSNNDLATIKSSVASADQLLTNLQTQIKNIAAGTLNNKHLKLHHMLKNIQEALEQYPFKNSEHELIKVDISNDFKYRGDIHLTNPL